jgi:serine protease
MSGPSGTISNADRASALFVAPEVSPAGENLVFQLTVADDDGATATDSVTAGIVNVNLYPVAEAGPNQAVYEGESVTLDGGNSNDPDGTITSFAWQLISGLVIDIPGLDQAQVSFMAPATRVTVENIYQVTVTDELGATSTDQLSLTIRPIVPPVANAGPDQVVESESTVMLSGAGSMDSDGTIVEYRWTQMSGPPVALDQATLVAPSFSAPLVSEFTLIQFQLVVTDDARATSVDVVNITVTPPQHDVSGVITVPEGNLIDSDVNDALAPYEPNDVPDIAQYLPGPVTVGGYANRAFAGADGRSYLTGDVSDFYRVQLGSGQSTVLRIGDSVSGDLDLYLWDLSGTRIIDASVGITSTEVVIAPADGEYLIEVYAWSGASNYVMSVEPPASPAAVESAASLHHDFVPYQAIARHQVVDGDAPRDAFAAEAVAALGLKPAAPPGALASLYSVAPTLDGMAMISGHSPGDLEKRSGGFTDSVMRSKWETLLAIKLMGKDPTVQYAEPNFLRQINLVPDDELFNRQWHYSFINVPAAWDVTLGDPSVVVAVIDTGALVDHPDLMGNMRNGYDFIRLTGISNDGDGIDPNPDDPGDSCGAGNSSFHGTHVQGTIGAATNNQVGVAGIAPGATIMPLRALGCGGGTSYDVVQAVLYAAGLANDSSIIVDDPADIINLSLGGGGYSQFAQDAYHAARGAGVIVVAAAGNEGTSTPSYPASYDGVISVSSVGSAGSLADYSNFGSNIDIAAPGGATFADVNNDGFPDLVYSTDGQDEVGLPIEFTYEYKLGTSMAAPHVAGVLALMKSVNGSLTPADIDAMLIRGEIVVDIGEVGWDPLYGWGLIDARIAVDAAIAAIGAPPGDIPAMIISPTDLQLGAFTGSTTFEISNAAGGTLVVDEISTGPEASWLSFAPLTVDGNGVGTYEVSVSRDGLPEGVYSTTVAITSNSNSRTLSAKMLVPPELVFVPSAGNLWVLLIDTETQNTSFATLAELDGGAVTYSFTGVYEGTYELYAGSDSDGDFFICDSGESCGAYTDYATPTPVTIDADTTGLDFVVDYSWFLPVTTGTSGESPARKGFSMEQID